MFCSAVSVFLRTSQNGTSNGGLVLPENKAHFLVRKMALLILVFEYKTTKNFVSLIQKFSVFIDQSFMNMNFFLEEVIL